VLDIARDVTREGLRAVIDTRGSRAGGVARELTDPIAERGAATATLGDRRGSADSPVNRSPEEGH